MPIEELAGLLATAADVVAQGNSQYGSITWDRRNDQPLKVVAVVQTENQPNDVKGYVVGDPDEDTSVTEVGDVREADLRAQTIRERMVNDIARANPMLGVDEVHNLADHGMFHVEHLLAEIEGLRHDNSTRSP